jgi:multiple sugar transport system substrate-binding protein
MPDFGHGPKTTMGSWSCGITSNCHDPVGAWTFIEYLISPQEILRMTSNNGAVPVPYFALTQSKLYSEPGPLRLLVEQLKSKRAIPSPNTPAYTVISKAFAEAVDHIINGADVKSKLTRAAEAIDLDIKAHNGYPAQ